MCVNVIGLDIGTTACKAILVTPSGRIINTARLPYGNTYDRDSACDLEHVVTCVLRDLLAAHEVNRYGIEALGVCGRGTGMVFLDRSRAPISVPWHEVRRYLSPLDPPPAVRYPKLWRWGRVLAAVREHLPDIHSSIAMIVTVKDYVNLWLTGTLATDPFSMTVRSWPKEDLREYGLDETHLPPLADPWSPAGLMKPEIAAKIGLSASVPVVIGGHDGVCANIGAGRVQVGEGCLTLGTRGVVRINTVRPVMNSSRFVGFTYPFLGELWTSGGDLPACGSALEWARSLLVAPPDGRALDEPGPVPEGPVFLPYLEGEESPEQNAMRPGIFADLRLEHTRGDLMRAIMEGIGFGLKTIYDQFSSLPEQARACLTVTGGGAYDATWMKILASTFACPLFGVRTEVSALGAAILAAVGGGLHESVEYAVKQMRAAGVEVQPVPTWVDVYERLYDRFTELRLNASVSAD